MFFLLNKFICVLNIHFKISLKKNAKNRTQKRKDSKNKNIKRDNNKQTKKRKQHKTNHRVICIFNHVRALADDDE